MTNKKKPAFNLGHEESSTAALTFFLNSYVQKIEKAGKKPYNKNIIYTLILTAFLLGIIFLLMEIFPIIAYLALAFIFYNFAKRYIIKLYNLRREVLNSFTENEELARQMEEDFKKLKRSSDEFYASRLEVLIEDGRADIQDMKSKKQDIEKLDKTIREFQAKYLDASKDLLYF